MFIQFILTNQFKKRLNIQLNILFNQNSKMSVYLVLQSYI